jgi:glycosyltransferase involved in cell wall biosynthesis
MPQKKKSILVDAHIFDKEPQGTTTYIKGLYNAFAEMFSEDYNIYITASNIDLLKHSFPTLPQQNFIPLKKCSSPERLTIAFPAIINKYKIDYAHFQQIAPLVKNCRFIVTVHDLLFNDFTDMFSFTYRFSRNMLFKKALKQADIKLTVSNYSREAIKKYYGIENVHITSNAVAERYFDAYDKTVSIEWVKRKFNISNYILYVSRIEERKNHLMLLKAYRKLKLFEKGIALVFVGRNDMPVVALEEEMNNLQPEEKPFFSWFQFVNDEELLELYRGSLLFVYPSIAEGFGIPPLEAAALKINTLCSNTTAMKDFDFFESNQFDPYNFSELCNKLSQNTRIFPSEDKLKEISDNIKKRYSWYTAATIINDLINQQNSV